MKIKNELVILTLKVFAPVIKNDQPKLLILPEFEEVESG